MKRWLPFIIVAVVALLALAGGAILYRSTKATALTLSKEQAIASAAEAGHVRGPAKAPVTIEEFGDFQCPPCAKLSEPLHQVERDFHKNVRVIFRQFPLVTHQHARAAAFAAEAAGLQGRFWEMHDHLYREQESWSKAPAPEELFISYAKMHGLDTVRFRKDMADEKVKARVAADQKRAADLGVTVTPTVFVNGKSLHGPDLSPQGLRAAVESALAEIPAH